MKFKAIFLIGILTFSFLAISFDSVNAGKTVDVQDGKIHIDALNGGTGFTYDYKIGFVDAQGNIFKTIIKKNKGCLHDEYYDIPSNTAKIRLDIDPVAIYGDIIKDIAPKTCGFKLWGASGNIHLDYNYFELDGTHQKGDRYIENMAQLGWRYYA